MTSSIVFARAHCFPLLPGSGSDGRSCAARIGAVIGDRAQRPRPVTHSHRAGPRHIDAGPRSPWAARAPAASVLRDAGHEVRWATALEACGTVAGLGFAVDPAGLDVGRPACRDWPTAFRRSWPCRPVNDVGTCSSGFFAVAAAPATMPVVRPLVESFRPDLVVHEIAELGIVPLAGPTLYPARHRLVQRPAVGTRADRRSPPSSPCGGRASASTCRPTPGWEVTATCIRSPPGLHADPPGRSTG